MNDTLTYRERELYEAARDVVNYCWKEIGDTDVGMILQGRLRAYDPPKRKYTMPTWEEFVAGKVKPYQDHICIEVTAAGDKVGIGKLQYETIREALSTEET